MPIQTTAIPDVLIIEPKVFGDDRGFFMRVLMLSVLLRKQVLAQISSRITIPNQLRAYCAVCITKSSNLKASWYA